jgi:tetraacyldisaccharide 4'-kinase
MSLKPLRKRIGIITYPLAIIYGITISIRNRLFNYRILKSISFKIPVISVGNITVGGTGKTPHIEYLVRLLKDDYNVAVLSRGYKRKTKDFIIASGNTVPKDIGDEPLQMHLKFPGITVAVDRKRVHGIRQLQKKIEGLKVVLLDDAYQHRYVTPGISILLVDYHRPVFKDFLLPFGDLREKRHEIKRANIVIVTKSPKHLKPIEKRIWMKELNLYPYQSLYFTTLSYDVLIPVYGKNEKKIKLEDISKKSPEILLISGIANPGILLKKVKEISKSIHEMAYKDHHDYTMNDAEQMVAAYEKLNFNNRIVITTEKDAVKIRNLHISNKEFRKNLYYLPVKVEFLEDRKKFENDIRNYVKKNKRIGKLYK